MPQEIEQLKKEIAELRETVNSMQNPATISPEFYQVLLRGVIQTSGISASNKDQTVNEAGASVYNVSQAMDGFIKIGNYNIPFFNP